MKKFGEVKSIGALFQVGDEIIDISSRYDLMCNGKPSYGYRISIDNNRLFFTKRDEAFRLTEGMQIRRYNRIIMSQEIERSCRDLESTFVVPRLLAMMNLYGRFE